jgi:hypothetical protein
MRGYRKMVEVRVFAHTYSKDKPRVCEEAALLKAVKP